MGAEQPVARPILVATDGGRTSAAALRVARALAARDGIHIEAVVVEERFPPMPGACISADALRLEGVPESTRLGRVRAQLCSVLEGNSWKLRVEFGRIGPTIGRAARASRASLILMGMTRDSLARRLLGSSAIARVLQSAQIPVLAVPATARELPHAAVAAIDFSPASLRAAHEACNLLARPGTLHLVHVRPAKGERVSDIWGWDEIYGAGASVKLQDLGSELAESGVTVLPQVETGEVIGTLSRVASEAGAEVVACGARNPNAIERRLLGHVPLQLVLSAECSVLIAPCAPSRDAPEELP
jgi:nucleotide-binding universal stress UspA family protein